MLKSAQRRLIVNADDFGWTHGVTDGIIEAHRDGIVTSTTLMARHEASEYALRRAREFPNLGVGIHLHLCDGEPASPAREVPSLVGSDGRLHSIQELRRRLSSGLIARSEIEREFRAQIQWMKARGTTPDHADSHHQVHLNPRVAGAFRSALLAEGITRARCPRQRLFTAHGPVLAHAGSGLRRAGVAAYMEVLQTIVFRVLTMPDARAAVHLSDSSLCELTQAWTQMLEHLPSGTFEVECHPGLQGGSPAGDQIPERRIAELQVLTDPHLRATLDDRAVLLMSYQQL